jgi:lysophospholipase L1-like esterase
MFKNRFTLWSMLYHYLALGDSYTIGEALTLTDSYPYQTVQLLRNEGYSFAAPEVIAKTGWTTEELQTSINNYQFLTQYDIVSLLIGVNNQYRGYSIDTYKRELKHLLQQALHFTGGNTEKVVVLSIPDYSVTPFAQDRNVAKIRLEIEAYNAEKEALCKALQVAFINITESTRRAEKNVHLLAADGLHPSAAEYRDWARLLASKVKSVLS